MSNAHPLAISAIVAGLPPSESGSLGEFEPLEPAVAFGLRPMRLCLVLLDPAEGNGCISPWGSPPEDQGCVKV